MKYIIFCVCVLLSACGGRGQKKQTTTITHSIEDTVRYQIGGKLYSFGDNLLEIDPSDSITVIGTNYFLSDQGELYREYRFIVHDRNTRSHRNFEPSALDSSYVSWKKSGHYGDTQIDSLPMTEYIDPAVGDFNGYWLLLTEYNGDYYFDDYMGLLNSFHIADSIVTKADMDGLYVRKLRKAVVSDGSLTLYYINGHTEQIEPFDPEREIYRYRDYFIIPARAIHNVEFIQWTNTTGDLI